MLYFYMGWVNRASISILLYVSCLDYEPSHSLEEKYYMESKG